MENIQQFVSDQREAVEDRDRERNRDRDRRDRDRSKDYRQRRDRSHSSRRDKRDDEGRRDYRNSRGRDSYDEGYEDNNSHDSLDQDKNEQNYGNYERSSRYNDSGYHVGRFRGSDTRSADKWIAEAATNTILVKGLPPQVEEKDIRAELQMSNTPIREVRLVKDKVTGASRGFAFVEFQSVNEAQLWMEQNQGELPLLGAYRCSLYYSTPKSESRGGLSMGQGDRMHMGGHNVGGAPGIGGVIGDWICSKCGVHNFKRREHCFKCNISREESDRGKESDGYDQVGHNPCNTLVLRGLDALTSEESLNTALQKVTILPLKNIHVIRDHTGVSLGYAFLEMESIAASTQLLDTIHRLQFPLEVDGKAVMVNFAKNTFTTVMASYNQQWNQGYSEYDQYYGSEGYDQYYGDYSNYQQQQQQQQYQQQTDNSDASNTQTDSTNAAAAVAQAAIQQAAIAKAYQKQHEQLQKQVVESVTHQSSDSQDSDSYPRYPTPDVSTFQYEETSGYYYDAQTGLYYDANSQYFYNSTTLEFLYWDSERHAYLPAPSDAMDQSQRPNFDGSAATDNTSEASYDDDRKESKQDKKEKVKMAKKIAKDMAKWAKSMNAAKEPSKRISVPASTALQQRKEAATADAGFALFQKNDKPELVKLNETETKLMPPPPPLASSPASAGGGTGLVASYGDGDDSDNDEDLVDEKKLVDLSKLACLLCKRQFPSKEGLLRHQQLSDLHKKNLAELKASKAGAVSTPGSTGSGNENGTPPFNSGPQQYRDRAKERREKYGAPAPPEVSARNRVMAEPPVPFEQPTKAGLGSDNVGNKLLQKMGWNAGQGLGKSKQGIVDPLTATRRLAGSGLGSQGSRILTDPEVSMDYRQAAKQQLFARYRELD